MSEVRWSEDTESVIRFIFQSKQISSQSVKKRAIHVAPNPDTNRHELSMFLLESMSDTTFWEDMVLLGHRSPDETAKGYGEVTGAEVRSFRSGFNVEVNHQPDHGHADVIGWSDDAEVRLEQTVDFAKILRPTKREQ